MDGLTRELSLKPNIKELTLKEFEAHLVERKEPSYRAKQIWQWLFQKRAASFAEMTNLSASLRARLAEDFTISRLAVLRQAVSRDGTKKVSVWSIRWSQYRERLDTGDEATDALRFDASRMWIWVRLLCHRGFGPEAKFAGQ